MAVFSTFMKMVSETILKFLRKELLEAFRKWIPQALMFIVLLLNCFKMCQATEVK